VCVWRARLALVVVAAVWPRRCGVRHGPAARAFVAAASMPSTAPLRERAGVRVQMGWIGRMGEAHARGSAAHVDSGAAVA